MGTSVPLRVLVVDDSPVQRRFLRAVVEGDAELAVVGEARNGQEAVALVDRLRPGVVLMDLDLPVMSGLEAIERIMAVRPTPIVVYSAFVGGHGNANAGAALAAGAVDVMSKPGPADAGRLPEFADGIRSRLRVAGRVKVITHPRGRLRAVERSAPGGRLDASVRHAVLPGPVQVVAVGASTGGPQALAALLGALPQDFAPAVVVVQHMADGFIEGLAGWLDDLCALPVVVGEHGRRLRPGTVCLAPGGRNLVVHEGLRVTVEQPPPTQFHVPGIDPTFLSLARVLGPAVVGVLLTGMGRDGAAGLRAMRERGAHTIAQDEETSAVYGMPGAAVSLDAVEQQLPLERVAPALLDLVAAPLPEALP